MMVLLCICSGHGCHEEGDYLRSPVTAVAVLVEHEDGSVHARLYLVSTALAPQRAVSAERVELFGPDGQLMPLHALEPGRYALSSNEQPLLRYQADLPYELSFSIDEPTAAEHHVFGGALDVELVGLGERPSVWMDQADGARAVQWSPPRAALVEVVGDDGEVRYRNIDLARDVIDYGTWDALTPSGRVELPAEAFAAGRTLVRVCAVDVHRPSSGVQAQPQHQGAGSELSERLGSLSGSLAGRCGAVEVHVAP
jgi:hypothetical protein